MFEITRKGADRLDITMSGKLNAEEMKTALDELVDKSEKIENGRMLYDVIDFHLPSLSAIAIEFSRFPAMFKWIRKFRRAAVLADRSWIKKVSELEGSLIPGLDIKVFDRNRRTEAEIWLSSRGE